MEFLDIFLKYSILLKRHLKRSTIQLIGQNYEWVEFLSSKRSKGMNILYSINTKFHTIDEFVTFNLQTIKL